MANGWEQLGAVLGGNNGAKEKAYQQGQERGGRLQKMLIEARMERDRELARQNFREQAPAAGISDIIQALTLASSDPSSGYANAQRGTGYGQQNYARQAAIDNAESEIPDPARQNAMTAAGSGKLLTAQTIDPAQVLEGLMALNQARVGSTNAQAESRRADVPLKRERAAAVKKKSNEPAKTKGSGKSSPATGDKKRLKWNPKTGKLE